MSTYELDSPKFTAGGTYKPTLVERLRESLRRGPLPEAVQAGVWPVSIDDISVWNGLVNFPVMHQVAQCVYIRAGYGNNGIDGNGEANAVGANDAGMPWGLYWFVKAGKDWKQHIANFKNVWQAYGGVLTPVWDCEYTDYTANPKQETTNWLVKLEKNWTQETGVRPMIYTRASWWDQYTYRTDGWKDCDLWIAHYTSAQSPAIPKDWSDLNNPRTWMLWQWLVEKAGAAHGVASESIDRNRFNGTVAAFNSKYGTAITELGSLPPTPPPTPGEGLQFQVQADVLNVRTGPGTNYPVVRKLKSGDLVDANNVGGKDAWIELAPGEWSCVQQNGVQFMVRV